MTGFAKMNVSARCKNERQSPSCLLCLAACALLTCVRALPESYETDWEFASPGRRVEVMPFVVSGAEFYRLTGAVRPAVESIRVLCGDRPVACQIDERNADGELTAGDGIVTAEDEICFYVELAANGPTIYCIKWSEAPGEHLSPSSRGQTSEPMIMETGALPNDIPEAAYVDRWFETERFRLGLNAEGAEDPTAHHIGNYGRGALTVVEFDGKRLTAIRSGWANVLPHHPFGFGPGKHRWTPLRGVCDGPVRTLVVTECPEWEEGVRAEFAIYHRGPAFDVTYTMRYQEREPESMRKPRKFGFSYPFRVGKKGDLNDVLLVPLAGRVDQYRLTEKDLSSFYPTHYQTPLPDEGWFAWVDTVESVGLAVFYEKMDAVRARTEWVDSRPVCNPVIRIRTTPHGGLENKVTWHRRNTHTACSWICCNRFVGLTGVDSAWLRGVYRLWGEPVSKLVKVSLSRPTTE